jgi:3',5'-cyclic-AMP phosphodiesterase
MRFVHISDTHIGPKSDYRLHDQATLPTLEALVQRINNLPFQPDFILHNGDVTDDANEASYRIARPVLEKLRAPVYYVMGNHDRPDPMLRTLLGKTEPVKRYDYYTEIDGFGLAVFDTRGPIDPAGAMTDEQFARLRDLCKRDGPPLIIAVHHQPVILDSRWLDEKWDNGLSMPLDYADAFREALTPARARIRGVFFGHVHRGFQAVQDGILYCSAPSALIQFESWPGAERAVAAIDELPGFGVVTVTPTQTLVRQYTFARPKLPG